MGPVTSKCSSVRCPGSGWSRGPSTLPPPPPRPQLPVLGTPWKEEDISSLVGGGVGRGRTGRKTRKKSLTPRKGLMCARSEGWALLDQSLGSFQFPTLKGLQ